MFFILKSFKIDILSLYKKRTKSVKNKSFFLVIPYAKERNYLALKRLSPVLRETGQGHFQILLIILQKEFIKSNLNTDMMMGSVKCEELNTEIASVVFNTEALNI